MVIERQTGILLVGAVSLLEILTQGDHPAAGFSQWLTLGSNARKLALFTAAALSTRVRASLMLMRQTDLGIIHPGRY